MAMNEQSTSGGEWRPICLAEKATGRKVHITIFERELYKSGFFTFEDLWQIYEEVDNTETENENTENPHQD